MSPQDNTSTMSSEHSLLSISTSPSADADHTESETSFDRESISSAPDANGLPSTDKQQHTSISESSEAAQPGQNELSGVGDQFQAAATSEIATITDATTPDEDVQTAGRTVLSATNVLLALKNVDISQPSMADTTAPGMILDDAEMHNKWLATWSHFVAVSNAQLGQLTVNNWADAFVVFAATQPTVDKEFLCSSDFLGHPECNTQQEFSTTLARSWISCFFGHNKNEFTQRPSSKQMLLCRKHYQRIGYHARLHSKDPKHPNSYPGLELKMIRAQLDKDEEWRPNALYRVKLAVALEAEVNKYNDLAAKGSTEEEAMGQLEQDRSDIWTKKVAEWKSKKEEKAQQAAGKKRAAEAQKLLEEAQAAGSVSGEAGSVNNSGTSRKQRKQKKSTKVKAPKASKETGQLDEVEEDDEMEYTEDLEESDEVGVKKDAGEPKKSPAQLTPLRFMIELHRNVVGKRFDKSLTYVRRVLDFIEAKLMDGTIEHLPAIEFLLSYRKEDKERTKISRGLAALRKKIVQDAVKQKNKAADTTSKQDENDTEKIVADLEGDKPTEMGSTDSLSTVTVAGPSSAATIDTESAQAELAAESTEHAHETEPTHFTPVNRRSTGLDMKQPFKANFNPKPASEVPMTWKGKGKRKASELAPMAQTETERRKLAGLVAIIPEYALHAGMILREPRLETDPNFWAPDETRPKKRAKTKAQ